MPCMRTVLDHASGGAALETAAFVTATDACWLTD